jgi:hypothetical protein
MLTDFEKKIIDEDCAKHGTFNTESFYDSNGFTAGEFNKRPPSEKDLKNTALFKHVYTMVMERTHDRKKALETSKKMYEFLDGGIYKLSDVYSSNLWYIGIRVRKIAETTFRAFIEQEPNIEKALIAINEALEKEKDVIKMAEIVFNDVKNCKYEIMLTKISKPKALKEATNCARDSVETYFKHYELTKNIELSANLTKHTILLEAHAIASKNLANAKKIMEAASSTYEKLDAELKATNNIIKKSKSK